MQDSYIVWVEDLASHSMSVFCQCTNREAAWQVSSWLQGLCRFSSVSFPEAAYNL